MLAFILGSLLTATAYAQDGTLPLKAGTALVQGQKYRSPSSNHYLIFQKDGNLAVYTKDDKRVWGLDSATEDYTQVKSIQLQADGNLVARGDNDQFIWSALSANPDANARLDVTAKGALQLLSNTRGVMWASDGKLAADESDITLLQKNVKLCQAGLTLLADNMYRHPEKADTAPAGRRAWKAVFDEFRKSNLPACNQISAFLAAYKGQPVAANIEAAMTAGGVKKWEDYFTGKTGVDFIAQKILSYCPNAHLAQYDCVAGPKTLANTSIPAARKALDLLGRLECLPQYGWAHCRMMSEPKIKIMGTEDVSQSAMDVVEKVYTELTSRFQPAYPKDKFDGYVIYITNAEPWSEISGLDPIGPMMGKDENGKDRGDELRGGTSPDYLWITEQMICKTGVETRENDTTTRTFDQVIHEFGHAIDFRYGLRERVEQVYAGGWDPVEQFPWSIQYMFGSPSGKVSASEQTFLDEIFTGTTTFSCDDYKPAAK